MMQSQGFQVRAFLGKLVAASDARVELVACFSTSVGQGLETSKPLIL